MEDLGGLPPSKSYKWRTWEGYLPVNHVNGGLGRAVNHINGGLGRVASQEIIKREDLRGLSPIVNQNVSKQYIRKLGRFAPQYRMFASQNIIKRED